MACAFETLLAHVLSSAWNALPPSPSFGVWWTPTIQGPAPLPPSLKHVLHPPGRSSLFHTASLLLCYCIYDAFLLQLDWAPWVQEACFVVIVQSLAQGRYLVNVCSDLFYFISTWFQKFLVNINTYWINNICNTLFLNTFFLNLGNMVLFLGHFVLIWKCSDKHLWPLTISCYVSCFSQTLSKVFAFIIPRGYVGIKC